MRADPTEEQAIIRDTLSRLLADTYDFETRRRLTCAPTGWSRDLWRSLAEMGLLAALAPEAVGGLAGGGVEAMLIAQELGAVLSAEPYLPTVVMAGLVMADRAPDALASLMDGETTVSWVAQPGLKLIGEGGACRLEGVATSAPWADSVDRLLVAAESDQGPVLLWLDPDGDGVARRPHRTFDGLPAADVSFTSTPVPPSAVLARGDLAAALIERAEQASTAWLVAEAVGLMTMALDATVEHLKSRVQFGQSLSNFQALQHRAAEMLVALETARSAAILAAGALAHPDALERRKLLAAAKLVASEASRTVGQAAVQLHGGIGVTEEHRVGWAFRRLTMISMLHGDAEAQGAALADLGGFVDAD